MAVILRLLAVIFSKGFMASDDHYQTVSVAYHWLQHGLWDNDGFLTWGKGGGKVSRFPLYNLVLFLNMKIMYAFGCESLDKIMYGVRFAHALFSLAGVWAVYKTVENVTASTKWAVAGGLFMAAHFVMPFLAVRNLIEMVGGIFWVIAIYYIYRYQKDCLSRWLILAGIASGLAFMIRFQLLFAMWLVPALLWIENRRFKPALIYGVTLAGMILISGLVDLMLMGEFMGSSFYHITLGATGKPTYETHIFVYVAVILGYFIPPFSIFAFVLACRKKFFKQHLTLTVSTLSFVLIHAVIPYRQERYMIPILPVLVLIIVLAMHQNYRDNGWLFRKRKILNLLVGFTLAINIILLIPFTVYYGHKGEVEPLAGIERISDGTPQLLFVTPEKHRIFPYLYGGYDTIGRRYIYDWSDLNRVFVSDQQVVFDYFILYPKHKDDLPLYLDSLISRAGPVKEVFHVEPSLIDYILHALNPKHNPTNECWVYKPV